MEWTPLVTSGMFTGIRADLVLAAAGILGLSLVIFGIAVLMRVMR